MENLTLNWSPSGCKSLLSSERKDISLPCLPSNCTSGSPQSSETSSTQPSHKLRAEGSGGGGLRGWRPAEASGCYGLPSQLPTYGSGSPHPHSGWAFPQPVNGKHSQKQGSEWVNEGKSGLRLKACSHIALRKSKCRPLTLGVGFFVMTQKTPARGMEFGFHLLNWHRLKQTWISNVEIRDKTLKTGN